MFREGMLTQVFVAAGTVLRVEVCVGESERKKAINRHRQDSIEEEEDSLTDHYCSHHDTMLDKLDCVDDTHLLLTFKRIWREDDVRSQQEHFWLEGEREREITQAGKYTTMHQTMLHMDSP